MSRRKPTPSGAPVSEMSKKSPLTAAMAPAIWPSLETGLRAVTYFEDRYSKETFGASRFTEIRFTRTWPIGLREST